MFSADDGLLQYLVSSAALSTSIFPPERLGDERTPGPPFLSLPSYITPSVPAVGSDDLNALRCIHYESCFFFF